VPSAKSTNTELSLNCGFQQFAQNCRLSADTISQFSMESTASADSKEPVYFAAMDIRKRLTENVVAPKTKFQVCEKLNCVMTL